MTPQAANTGDPRWPRLKPDEGEASGTILLGDKVSRVVPPTTWDMDIRLEQMDASGIDCHVISPVPLILPGWADADLALASCQFVNDWIASSVAVSPTRLLGLGIVPMQNADMAVREMHRAIDQLGLVGLEIATVTAGQGLDHHDFRPFFRAASVRGVPLFLHPTDHTGAARCSSALEEFGIGVLTDTCLGASALLFNGLLKELPDLRICLSHGGGGLPWMYPRLKAKATMDGTCPSEQLDELLARFFVDSITFDPEQFAILRSSFGIDHVLFGSDYPLLTLRPSPREVLDQAVNRGLTTRYEADKIRGANALAFLNRN